MKIKVLFHRRINEEYMITQKYKEKFHLDCLGLDEVAALR